MFNSKKRVKDLSAPGAAAGPAGAVTAAAAAPGSLPGLGPTSAGNIQKLEMAKRLALKINAQKNLGAEAQVRQAFAIMTLSGLLGSSDSTLKFKILLCLILFHFYNLKKKTKPLNLSFVCIVFYFQN